MKGGLRRNGILTPSQQAFLLAFDGDVGSTCQKLGISKGTAMAWMREEWFVEGMNARNEREGIQLSDARVKKLGKLVMDRISIQRLWTDIALNEEFPVASRLVASKLLADSLGLMIQRIEVGGDEERPITVRQVDLEDRIAAVKAAAPSLGIAFLED